MTEAELHKLYSQIYRFITSERIMRERVFPPGHPDRDRKLAACDNAMSALVDLKDFAKQHATPSPHQAALFDEGARVVKKGGY